jgi:hypothetical protein
LEKCQSSKAMPIQTGGTPISKARARILFSILVTRIEFRARVKEDLKKNRNNSICFKEFKHVSRVNKVFKNNVASDTIKVKEENDC